VTVEAAVVAALVACSVKVYHQNQLSLSSKHQSA